MVARVYNPKPGTISVEGSVGLLEYKPILAALHTAITKEGRERIVLDFSSCTRAYPGPMLALGSIVARWRREGVLFSLTLPSKTNLKNRFFNTGWAHLLAPDQHQDSTYRGYINLPVQHFSSAVEQKAVVDQMIDSILSAQHDLSKGDLAAIEWAMNEIVDNVLVHSESEVGGFFQLTNIRTREQVEFVVADPGLGIPATLKNGDPKIHSDTEALDRAIREGVTRDKSVGQGNGLFGTFEVAQVGTGYLHVHSGYARLEYGNDELRTRSEHIPLAGTLVVATVDISDPDKLAEALRFDGKKYEPFDYIESHFELPDRDALRFDLEEESASLGSRRAGEPVRNKLKNLAMMNPDYVILVDLKGIHVISSSFADEVFGKLFKELGPLRFMKQLKVVNVAPTVSRIIDKAVLQRAEGD